MSEPGPSSSPKGSPTSSPGGGGGGGVLGRLLHSLRPPLKRTYTSNQINTSQNNAPGSAPASGGNSPSPSSSSLSGSVASASVSRRNPRRSNSSPPRPPSSFSRRKSGGGSNNMALQQQQQQQQQEDASHQYQGQTVSSVSGNNTPNINAPSPRSSNEYSNNSRYSPNGSSNYEHSFSETASRHTTRQASPLASPIPKNASSPNLSVHLLGASSSSTSAAGGAGASSTSSSQRPPLDRRQSSSRRLAAKLSRPLFRRTSSQKDAQQQQQSQRIDAAKSSSSINNAIHPLSSSSMASSSSSAAEQPQQQQQQQRRPPSSLGPGSGPPSPAIGSSSGGNSNGNNGGSVGKRPFTISSATARSTASSSQQSHAHSVTTPLAISETASAAHQHHQQHHHHQQSSSTSSTSPYPSPFFSQATPTTNIANPFAPPIDCVPPLTAMLAQPITATLAQLVPLSLLSPYASQQALCGHNALGSLPSASTTSIASSSISEAPTSSSAQHTAATSSIHPSSSSYHSMTPSMTSTFACNEQLAASSLSIPTTAIGTVWRLAKASEWVSQHGSALNSLISNRVNPMTPRAVGPSSMTASSNTTATTATAGASTAPQRLSQLREVSGEGSYGGAPLLPVFDFSAMLQAVVDILASSAGERGVDLVFYHGHRHQYYPDSRRASVASQREASQADVQSHELQEAFVRADERGLGVAILVMLRQIMNDLQSGTTLEVGLSVALTTPVKPNADLGKQQPQADQDLSALSPDSENDDDDDEDEDDVQLGTYMLTIEITTSRPRGNSSASSMTGGAAQAVDTNEVPSFSAGQRDQKVDPAISSALFQYLRLSFMTLPHRENRQEYKITCALPQARSPPRTVLNADHALRRRKPLDQNKEPSLGELLRFAESSLRGKKVALHALEHSTFAHHLSHHLANWGLEVSHVPVASEDDVDPLDPRMRARPDERGHLGRLDSGFGGSDGTSPPQSTATPSVHNIGDPMASATASAQYSMPAPTSSISAAPIDPTLSFIIIDDDITALKKQVMAIKNNAPTLQLQNALLAKRPQLHSRRTRSTQAVQRVAQPPVSIIHFTSLSRYRQIKELVHATLKSASPVFALPEVLVVPKPVGPRRLLNTLYNAVRRPPFDPYYIPIATSPSSPGGHYFFTGSRPSPAPSNQNEFEAAAAAEMSRQRNEQSLSAAVSQISGPGTPPVPGQVSNPPSPASPDAMEYFSKSASELGSSASQGIIIQSPDGRPTGLFFQPRAASLAEKAESLRMSRNGGSDSSSEKGSLRESSHSNRVPKLSPAPGHFQLTAANGSELPSIVIPENMDLAAARAFSVSSSKSSPQPTPGLTQRATDHNAQATQAGDTSASKPAARTISESYSDDDRDSSTDSLDKQANNKSKEEPSPKSPRHPATSPPSKSPASPPLERPERQPALSPISTGRISSPPTAQLNTPASVDPVATPTAPAARARNDRKASGRIRKPPRRPTGTLVPPINVLIVEDNPINQIILSTFLKRKGIKYSVANNGQEAVDQWKAGDFHLVLMDIQLPVKDGIEATQEIRGLERSNNTQFVMSPVSESGNPISASNSTVSSPYELPVIIVALTASNLQSDRVNALAAGCNDFLTKPVSLQWLNQKLVEWGSMAYLSGFSNKRRNTISNPRDQSQENKSLGAQAVDLSSRLETQKKEESSIGKQNVVKPVDGPDNADVGTSQGDETPRLATRDHTPSASGEPATA